MMKHSMRFFFKVFVTMVVLMIALNCSSNDNTAKKSGNNLNTLSDKNVKKATFAGGCFWCVESAFEEIQGIVAVISGYSGGYKKNPTYKQVSSGATEYAEAIQISYNPEIISYWQLLDILWKNIDPTDSAGSFHDRGKQYRSAIFYHDEEQKILAEKSKKKIESLGVFDKPIVTKIEQFKSFYKAENYHQDFYKTNPGRYHSYRKASGRDDFIKKHWGDLESRLKKFQKPTKEELRQILTPLQYRVTQENGTEPSFNNIYWDSKKEGIYVDIVSGEPLFSSTDKFKSGTGWPSFTKPLDEKYIQSIKDTSHNMVRIEVRSKLADSHLGHVFSDGPAPTGLRYCLNSAALWFISKKDLEKLGYGRYLKLFQN